MRLGFWKNHFGKNITMWLSLGFVYHAINLTEMSLCANVLSYGEMNLSLREIATNWRTAVVECNLSCRRCRPNFYLLWGKLSKYLSSERMEADS